MPVSEYTPTVAEVGALVRARTVDAGGNETGTFSNTTRPSEAEVLNLINDCVQECYSFFGQDIPDSLGEEKNALRNSAKRCVSFGAAALVELSYFPEQVGTNRSPYKMYQERYEKGHKVIAKSISDIEAGDEPGKDDESQLALYDGFPVDEGGMVGWNTVW
jgi:hypothetical protein